MHVGYGDVVDLVSRLTRTARVDTIIGQTVCVGQEFSRPCFTSPSIDRVVFAALHDLMREATIRHEHILRSAARGAQR